MAEQDRGFFARLSRELMEPESQDLTLKTVATRAVAVIPGCEFVGISLRHRRRRVSTVMSTDARVEECDALQYALDEGPCLDAIWSGDVYVSNDLSSDPRWRRWGPEVADRGMHSIIAIRIADAHESIGALNLYASQHDAYDGHALDVATTFGYHAANALVSAKLVEGLESSLKSRHTIGMAQGILMTRYAVGADQAFTVLQRYSSQHNVRLRDLAAVIVATGGLPEEGVLERRDLAESTARADEPS